MSDFKKSQKNLVKALEELYDSGGYMEKDVVCKATKILHPKIFALSYPEVYEDSLKLLKKCKRLK